jgi:Arc/MetJ-type ribon-helix-helix transcriptional regulator
MRTTKVLSITLPEPMLASAKKLAKKENRTMSELVREALRRYEAQRWLEEIKPYARERASARGVATGADVDRVIDEYRRERRARPAKRRAVARSGS